MKYHLDQKYSLIPAPTTIFRILILINYAETGNDNFKAYFILRKKINNWW